MMMKWMCDYKGHEIWDTGMTQDVTRRVFGRTYRAVAPVYVIDPQENAAAGRGELCVRASSVAEAKRMINDRIELDLHDGEDHGIDCRPFDEKELLSEMQDAEEPE